jgi:aconitate hydratase
MYLGVRLLLAKSVERIHAGNLVNFGILLLTFDDPADYDRLKDGDELRIENVRDALKGDRLAVENATGGYRLTAICPLTERQKAIVLAGGALNYAAASAGR